VLGWIALRPLTPATLHWRGFAFLLLLIVLLAHTLVTSKRRAEEQPSEAPQSDTSHALFLLAGLAWCFGLAWICVGMMGSQVFHQGFLTDLAGDRWFITKAFMLLLLAAPIAFLAAFLAASAALLALYGVRWLHQTQIWRHSGQVGKVLAAVALALGFGHIVVSPATGEHWQAISFVIAALGAATACVVMRVRSRISEPGTDATLLAVFVMCLFMARLLSPHPRTAATFHIIGSLAMAALALIWITTRALDRRDLSITAAVGLGGLLGIVPATKTFLLLPMWEPEAVAALGCAVVTAAALATLAPALLYRLQSKCAMPAAMLAIGLAALATSHIVAVDQYAMRGLPDMHEKLLVHEALAGSLLTFGLALVGASAALMAHIAATMRLDVPAQLHEGRSDLEKLQDALAFFTATLLSAVQSLCGPRAADRLAATFSAQSDRLDWRLSIADGRMDLSQFGDQDLASASGTLYAAVESLSTNAQAFVGVEVVERTVTRVYDLLPWDSRELATTRLFHKARWAEALGSKPRIRREDLQARLHETLIFQGLDESNLNALCRRFGTEHFTPGQVIVRQGDDGDRFYVMQQGAVEVIAEAIAGPPRVLAHLHAGDYFGEIALLERCPRTATVRAETEVTTYALKKEDFDEFVADCTEAGELIVNTIGNVRRLGQVPIFHGLPESQTAVLLTQFKIENVDAGATIFCQGDAGDKFYVVREGKVAIVASKDSQPGQEIATLGPGEYFGEIALLSSVPRTATAQARTDVELWTLEGHVFLDLVKAEHVAVGTLRQTASRRLLQLRKRLL